MNEELFSQNAEIAILSLLLRDITTIEKIRDLKSQMFSSIPNRVLFESIIKLYQDGNIPEYSLIITTLKSRGLVANVGGESYLQYLYNQTYDINNLDEFIRILVNSYKTRKLISIYSNLPDLITNENNIDEVISNLKLNLDELNLLGSSDTVESFEDASVSAMKLLVDKMGKSNKIDYTTNFKNLDGVTGGYGEGDLWTVAGRPGMGKSSFLCNSALSGIPALVFSFEMPKETLVQRMLSIRTGIPVFSIRNGLISQKELNILNESIESMRGFPIYIDSKFFVTPEYISSTIRKYVKNYGIKIVHLDYIQLLIERSMSATHDIGRLTRELKLLSNDLKITCVMYSQLNRMVELREDKRPILSDLRQSGNIEEDVDVALFLYRDDVYNLNSKEKGKMEFLIRKQRNGPTGVLYTKFNSDTNRIEEE